MIYGILAGNKLHLSEIARSLNENITLKKTIDRLSRNLSAFKEKETVMKNYISEVKKQINEENAVIVIDNSDITKPCSPKMEAISDVHDGSTGEIRKGYFTVEAAVLSQNKKMPLPVYEKVFSAAEKGVISATHENLQCLKSVIFLYSYVNFQTRRWFLWRYMVSVRSQCYCLQIWICLKRKNCVWLQQKFIWCGGELRNNSSSKNNNSN